MVKFVLGHSRFPQYTPKRRSNGFVDNRKVNEDFALHDATPETTEIIATDGFESCECRSTELARHTHIHTHMRTREAKCTTMMINRL